MNAIADDVRVQMAAAAVDHRAAVDGMVADAKRLRVSWMDAVGAISGSLSGIGGNAGGFLASISKIESSFKSLDEAASRFSAKGGGTAANFAALGTSFASIATALVAVGLQLWNVYEAEQKADAETRAYEQSQADLGVTLSGPTITAIQASQKAFLALYTGMITGNKVFNDLLATLGGKVTPAFQAQIGEAMNLTAVIKDLGGVSAANVGKIEQLAGVTLKLTGMGGATGAQAMQELSGALQELGTYAEKTGGLWDDAFKKLITDAAAAGIAIDTINSLVAASRTSSRRASPASRASSAKTPRPGRTGTRRSTTRRTRSRISSAPANSTKRRRRSRRRSAAATPRKSRRRSTRSRPRRNSIARSAMRSPTRRKRHGRRSFTRRRSSIG
jgi:hypothetical protein